MMGLTLGPVTGEIVAAAVLDGTPAADALAPARYTARRAQQPFRAAS